MMTTWPTYSAVCRKAKTKFDHFEFPLIFKSAEIALDLERGGFYEPARWSNQNTVLTNAGPEPKPVLFVGP